MLPEIVIFLLFTSLHLVMCLQSTVISSGKKVNQMNAPKIAQRSLVSSTHTSHSPIVLGARSTCTALSSSVKDGSLSNIDWSFADEVYLITTTASSSRLDRTKEQLQRVGLSDRVQVRVFKPDDEDRVRGCYTSHIKVLQEIKKKLGNKKNFRALILEDNLETTIRMSPEVIDSVADFAVSNTNWDVFHLAYMMYVPGLSLSRLADKQNIVRMIADAGSSVGTSAYLISKSGVDAILKNDKEAGYVEAIPNVMAHLFPSTRFACYPMVFHRAAKIGSLVNPQLDDFRKIMFSPVMYTTWERLMVSTGLQNNQLFPGLSISLLVLTGLGIYRAVTGADTSGGFPTEIFLLFPLLVAGWGASLFTSGATGAGFAKKNVSA